MASLSDRLKSLGVNGGMKNIPPLKPRKNSPHPIERVISGDWWPTAQGDIFYVETRYQADFKVGTVPIKLAAPLKMIAAYARDPQITDLTLEQFAFLDTETTGLAGGAGTYAFMVGIGRFEGDEFRLAQFFLQDPAEEPAQLAAIEEFLSPAKAIVSYNGKSFDWPLLKTRYITNGWLPPLPDAAHIDLLHLARRMWKDRLPSRTLGELEVKILGTKRSEQDVPGWMIADLYFDYLRSGDARPLRGVFYHNEVDIVSLAALLNHMAGHLEKPLSTKIEHGLDILAIGKLYADLGHIEGAVEIYQLGLENKNLPETGYWGGLRQLSFLYKKLDRWPEATEIWQKAAAQNYIYAHLELAKMYEHRQKDYETACQVTEKAIAIVSADRFTTEVGLPDLEHRLNRLTRKINKTTKNKA
jgi:uncharacterized protein